MTEEIRDFEAKFDSTIKEVLVLTEGGTGAGRSGKEKMWKAHITILAMIDVETGELAEGKRQLTWLLTDGQCQTRKKIFGLEAERIYRLKVQKSLEFTNQYNNKIVPQGARLLVRKVVGRNCSDSRLEEILKKYQQPVIIHPKGCKELLLDKSLGMFCGDGVWNGQECMVHLDVDHEGSETAEDALRTWNKLLADCVQWDKKARNYAAKELVDTANDWLVDGMEEDEEIVEITEEIFAKRMGLSEVCISTKGDFEIYYDDDDMFWGHVIIVSGNIEDGFDDATIAG